MIMRMALFAAVLTAPVAAEPLNLHLICDGVGDHQVAHGSSGTIFGHRGAISAFGVSHSQEQFGEQMDINFAGEAATARVPRRFLPPLHGGQKGVFPLKDVVVTDDAITGTVLINYANHPKLRLDRRTGSVSMDGKVGAYAGECHPYDPTAQQRAF